MGKKLIIKIKSIRKVCCEFIIWTAIFVIMIFQKELVNATPLYGPVSPNGVGLSQPPSENYNLPQSPSGAVQSPNSPGFAGQSSGGSNQNGSSSGPSSGPGSSGQGLANPVQGGSVPGNSNSSQAPTPTAPSFMTSTMPNSANPFLPNNVSPGLISGPLENAYLLNGVPQLAAPLMSVVYRPFGLTYFQPNPFQVAPQGTVSLTGTFEADTNINFSPNKPEPGALYSITPAVMYTNFDDYAYISLLGSVSYYSYLTGNIPPYFDEFGGLSVGSYLGTRVFVGAQDFFFEGSNPVMNGQPLAFLNGINASYGNMSDAELGVALTPKITFVQAASDMYLWNEGYGAGFMNLQSLTDSLNYMDRNDYLTASYIYQQGFFSDFPDFYSNGVMGTAMRTLSRATSLGIGGSLSYYFYQNLPLDNTIIYSYYGILSHKLNKSMSFSVMGGWNVVEYDGLSFQAPLVDVNLGYSGPRLSLGINAGEFAEIMNTYGIEMGPEYVKMILGYLSYQLGSKTLFTSSVGYTYYTFLAPAAYSNNFFQNLQSNVSYNGSFLSQTDAISYHPYNWLSTTLLYNMIDFSTNIPNETVIDNQFIAMVSFSWNFK